MGDSRRFADELVERAFAERFPEGVPDGLGGAVLDRISGCLCAEGFSEALVRFRRRRPISTIAG